MTSIKDYLREFNDLLILLHDENMVIGGIHALKLHGLEVRDTADLDIVLYQPSENVIKIIQNQVKEDQPDDYPRDLPESPRRSYKITKNGLTIDFLIEYDAVVPDDLMFIPYSYRALKVQRIDVIIDAKRKYGRDKDLQDFIELKEKNFNV